MRLLRDALRRLQQPRRLLARLRLQLQHPLRHALRPLWLLLLVRLLCSLRLPLRLLGLLLLVRPLCSLRLPLRLLWLLLQARLLCSLRLPLRLLGLLLLVRRTRGRNRSRCNRRSASLRNRPHRPPAS